MAAICDAAIHLCRTRVTRLTQTGFASPGPNNVYVTDKPIMIQAKPVIQAGDSKPLISGCDCLIANYRGTDKLLRFDLEFDLGVLEPGLQEMMLGGSAVLAAGQPIGLWWANQQTCEQPSQPNVCFEGWQDLWESDHPAATPYRYVRWIWPSTFWQIADFSLQNDFNQPKLTGYSRGNPNWGMGIYADQPEAAQLLGGYFYDNTLPVAACGWQSHSIT